MRILVFPEHVPGSKSTRRLCNRKDNAERDLLFCWFKSNARCTLIIAWRVFNKHQHAPLFDGAHAPSSETPQGPLWSYSEPETAVIYCTIAI